MRRADRFRVKSIQTGLGILFLLLLAALTLLFTLIQVHNLTTASREDLQATVARLNEHLETEAVLLAGQLSAQAAQPLASFDFTGLCSTLAATVEARDELLHAALVHSDGVVFASSDLTEVGRNVPVIPPDWTGVEATRTETVEREGEEVLNVSVPVRVAGRPWGSLVLSRSLAPLREAIASEERRSAARVRRFWISSVLVGSLILASGSALALRLGKYIAGPVVRLAESSRLIARGNLDEQVPRVGSHEIESLSESMEEMRLSIRLRVGDLNAVLAAGRSMAGEFDREELCRLACTAVRNRLCGASTALFVPHDGRPWTLERCFGEPPGEQQLGEIHALLSSGRRRTDSAPDPITGGLLFPVSHSGTPLAAVAVYRRGQSCSWSDEERVFAGTVANTLAVSLMNVQLLHESMKRERIAHEMSTARAVQRALFPRDDPRLPWIDVSGAFHPATETGGDWFGYVHREGEESFTVLIGDVTGHGVPPALVTAAVHGSCATLAGAAGAGELTPARILEELNRTVFCTGRRDLVMTLFAARFEREASVIRFANAGHPLPMVISADGNAEVLAARGPRLGDFPESRYTESVRLFEKGETFLFYTDGLIENATRSGEPLGRKGLRRFLARERSETACSIRDRLLRAVISPGDAAIAGDDVAMVVLRMKEGARRCEEVFS